MKFTNIYQHYTQLKQRRQERMSLWQDIADFVGIAVDPNYWDNQNNKDHNSQIDQHVDDPTAAISVIQAGDYLHGLMWGTGEGACSLVPSRNIIDKVDPATVEDFYNYASEQVLYHINHPQSGFLSALRGYCYDENAFGTAGVGTFPNKGFMNGVDQNALVFRHYGVDNMAIDEGKNGLVEHVYVAYNWTVNRIIGEFCTKNGVVDDRSVNSMPKAIADAYRNNNLNENFNIVFGARPRDDFDPKLKGKKGTRYSGHWFMDDGKNAKDPFFEESFKEKPIAVARMIKVRGDVYGRSSGTMLLSTIRSVNFMVGTVIEILEKMGRPSLGIYNSTLFGDNVLDTSPESLTVFNEMAQGGKGNPVFPLYDVGDPSGIINYLIPYLNEKITTAFKIDLLLDFNSAKDMTATESLQRATIRGQSLTGMLQQQKVECLEPTVRRSVSLLEGMGELGIDPRVDEEAAQMAVQLGRAGRVIPDVVIQAMENGEPWYDIVFHNEVDKLGQTKSIENLTMVLNTVTAIMSVYPAIVEAVDFYKLLKDINDTLGTNNEIVLSEQEFREKVEAAAQAQAAQMQAHLATQGASAQKDMSQANKNNMEATGGQ